MACSMPTFGKDLATTIKASSNFCWLFEFDRKTGKMDSSSVEGFILDVIALKIQFLIIVII